jgi:hypothetical protein
MFLKRNIDLENQCAHKRQEANSMPSPFRRGTTDTPITNAYLGEVQPKPLSLACVSRFQFEELQNVTIV